MNVKTCPIKKTVDIKSNLKNLFIKNYYNTNSCPTKQVNMKTKFIISEVKFIYIYE